jgi:hypothetical protein
VSEDREKPDGFVTFAAAALLSALVLIALSHAAPVPVVLEHLEATARRREARAAARDTLEEVIRLLEADPTPQAQSVHDPLWQRTPPGVVVDEPLPPSAGGDGRYTYANVNAARRQRLRKVAAGRLPPDVSAQEVLEPVLDARERGEVLTPQLLRHVLGEHYESLAPAVSARALVNANTATAAVLARLIAAHTTGLDAARTAARIVQARAESELARGDLAAILERPADAPVFAVLGVRSFTVRLEIRIEGGRGGRVFEALVLRVPERERPDRFQVVRLTEHAQ